MSCGKSYCTVYGTALPKEPVFAAENPAQSEASVTGPACPTGNRRAERPQGVRGSDGGLRSGLSRPDRARANNARNADFLGATPVSDQAGFGTEDMIRPANYLGTEEVRPSDAHGKDVPDLASMGDGGETFGGV